jgi:outer membrane protein OmpA-like peptidoglycan-associated protein
MESAAAGDLPPARHRGRYGGYVVMAVGKTRYCGQGSDRKLGRRTLQGVVAALLLGLGACNPIEGYRHLTGASKNDPDPATTPNTQNLAAGEKSPYPNLATVPPPPTQALTTVELDKLTQSLIADRKNAKYTSEQLQAGFDEAAGPPPPPPPAPPAETASSGAAEPPAAPTGGPKAATAPSGAGTPPTPGQVASATPAAAAKGPRKTGEPPEPGPMESSLQSPQISSLPEPQQSQPPPPPPPLLRMPAASAGAGKSPAALAAPPAPAPIPTAIASAEFQPPPAPPVIPPAGATRTAAATGPGKSGKQPPAGPVDMPVAQINFAADSTTLSDADRQSLGAIVPLYRRDPGKVRVVGYTGVGSSADQQLNGFQAALDRAQAVAAALAKAGIPQDKILVEAAPVGEDSGQSRAEVLLEH